MGNSFMDKVSNIYDNMFEGYFHEHIKGKNWQPFFNHGYLNKDNLDFFNYDAEDLLWKNQCNLYAHVFFILNKQINNLSLLDVGCGLGHGTYVYKKYFNIKNITAIDINKNQIKFAKENFKGIDFRVGNAMDLQFENNSFDMITNIESLHGYKYTDHFYKESYRILKSQGFLYVTDPFVPIKEDHVTEDFFKKNGFWIKEKLDITENVIRACEQDFMSFKDRFKHIHEKSVDFFIDLFKHKYNMYCSGQHVFLTYILVKP